jgi:tetratricopeptide (TPR) repeat protein
VKRALISMLVLLAVASAAAAQDLQSLMGAADAFYEKGDYRNAALYYEQGLAAIEAKAPGEDLLVATVHLRLGDCYLRMNNQNNALLHYFEALDRAKRGIVVDPKASGIVFGAYGAILDIYDQQELTKPMLAITDEFIAFIQEYNKSPLPEDVIPKAAVNNFLAYCWAQKGERLDEALALIEESLKSEPKDPAYLDTKGWILLKMGRVDEAKSVLTKALDLCKKDKDPCVVIETHLKKAAGRTR